MAATYASLLLQLAQVAVNRRQAHRCGAISKGTMQLLPTHLAATMLQFIQELALACIAGRGWAAMVQSAQSLF